MKKTRTSKARHVGSRAAYRAVLWEILAALIPQSDAAATVAALEARFRLLAQDPPRCVTGRAITEAAEHLLGLFRRQADAGNRPMNRTVPQ